MRRAGGRVDCGAGEGGAVAVLAFGSGVIGLRLRAWLPERHAPDLARDMIGAMTGLPGLLLALVLGTLIGASYTLYATQKAELETLAACSLQLDAALEAYGPETKPARDGLRAAVTQSYDKIWGRGTLGAEEMTVRSVSRARRNSTSSFSPRKPTHRSRS